MRSENWRNEIVACRGTTGSGRTGKQGNLFSGRRKKKSGQTGLKGRRGSAVVLLCILFVTIAGALAVTYEAADRKAAINLSEAAFDSAGRSILACYDKPLFERYGIFAFEGDEDKTEKRLKKIAEQAVETPEVAGCRVEKVEVEQAAYSLTDPDNLMLQIREITKRSSVVDILGSLKEDVSTAEDKVKEKEQAKNKADELEKEREEAKRKAEEAVEKARQAAEEAGDEEAVEAASSSPELSEIENAEKVQNELKERADSIKGEKSGYDSEGRSLKNGRVSESLPSAVAGCKEKRAYAGGSVLKDLSEDGAGEALGDDLISTGYIESFFRNELDEDSADDHFFRCEVEYILYGCMSDEENYKKAYHSIFAVRTAVNTAYLYMDPEKSALILATAEAMTPGPFAPLTQILLTLAWAAVESENDMKNLEAGNGVPLIKNSATWMTDIDGAAKGAASGEDYIPIPGDSPMTYSRYLDMLLLTLDRDTKLYRIMDLIQINLKGTERADFTMSDHFTGLALKAEVAKKSHAAGVVDSSAEINMIHTYLTGG